MTNKCFAYSEDERGFGRCAALIESASSDFRRAGVCGTIQCPFFKPRRDCVRIGDTFYEWKGEEYGIY